MKLLIPAILAVAAAGCADVITRDEYNDLSGVIEKHRAEMINKNDMAVRLYEQLVGMHDAVQKKSVETGNLVAALTASVQRLEDQIKTLQGQIEGIRQGAPAVVAPPVGPAVVVPPPPKRMTLQEILAETEVVLVQLKTGKINAEKAGFQLLPYAKDAAPRIVQELRGALADPDYAKQLEAVLARFPAEELKTPLQGALGERGLRESAARVVGASRSPELAKVLEEHAQTPDEDFRLLVGDALVQCRNAKGLPLLVACLRSPQAANRTIAIASLRRLNRGQDLGYRAPLGPDPNAQAIKDWEDWAAKFGPHVFE
jgi:hypothetical protein